MRGADASAGAIKSGGKTRRAAKMVILNADHPDVEEFIWCKAIEERKARDLQTAGWDMSLDGKDSFSVQYQNANNSVRVTDDFMQAVENDDDWDLKAVTTGKPSLRPSKARELSASFAEAAWECADPGMQFDTTINRWHTTPNAGRINGSNPCSEYMHLDNSACNLASINLLKFLERRFQLRYRSLQAHRRADLYRPGNPGRLQRIPDQEHHQERPGLPRAGYRLRQPGRAADGPGLAIRQR
jgi:ribonucleoside-diphosphate reductase alpha chain